jgi:hypothetical protein
MSLPPKSLAASLAVLAIGCGDSPTLPVGSSTRATFASSSVWESRPSLLGVTAYASGIAMGGRIYAVTGEEPHVGERSTLQIFDPYTGTWTYGRPMNHPRDGFATAELNGRIFVGTGHESTPELESYDPASDTWTSHADVPNPRRLAAGASTGGRFYVIGGCASSGSCDKVHAYDPATDQWAARAPMPTGRLYHVAAAIDGIIYVTGGYAGNADGGAFIPTTALEAYDPQTNTWTVKASMPTARIGAMAAVVNGKLYVISGHDGYSSWTNVVEIYDPVSNAWTSGPSIPTARMYGGAAALNGNVHVFGGNTPTLGTAVHEALVRQEPVTAADCKKDGWRTYGFANQGQCVRFIETGKDSR